MSTAPALVPAASEVQPVASRFDELRRTVLNGVSAESSKRNYALALDELSAFCKERQQGISRTLILEFRAALLDRELSPSTINVKLSAIRKLVDEAKRAGFIGAEEASEMSDVPNVAQRGTRLGNWLTKEQARELLAVPDRSTTKGKRDYCILALLVGCALRRRELASLSVEDIQMRSVNKVGKVGETLSDWAVWSVVTESAKEIGIERFGAHDLRRTCAKLCRKAGGDLEQIKFLLGHSSIQTTERYLGSEQEIAVAVNDNLGL